MHSSILWCLLTSRARLPIFWHSHMGSGGRNNLELTLAISDYDHVRDLTSGLIRPEGIELRSLDFRVEEIFFRFAASREWDLSEFSMAKYCSLVAAGESGLTAIPVFPSRVFRHSSFYVRRGGDIKAPADFAGRRVGVPEWAQTAGVYARALITHEYGVALKDIEWVQAGVNEPGRQEQAKLRLPEGVELRVEPARSLTEMLLAGDIDVIITAHPPDAYSGPGGPVVRLFEDYEPLEADYYARTGIFPIMHTVAIRRDVYEQHRWMAMNMLKAFEQSKQRSVSRLREITASRFPLPWSPVRAAEAEELMGEPWPYGIEKNATTLDAFLGYCFEQGVCIRRLKTEELFAPEVTQEFRV